MKFKPCNGSEWWVNFPKEHVKKSDAKHDNFRETVRVFKNARDHYDNNNFFALDAPSYYIECLLYNVPDDTLKTTDLTDRFDDVVSWLEQDSVALDSFQQASEMEALFGDENTQWNTNDAEEYIDKMRVLFDNL